MSSRKQSDEKQLPEELAALERVLASFEPVPGRVDRDRLMFDAGAACGMVRASTDRERGHAAACRGVRSEFHARRRVTRPRPWPMATAAVALVACMFASLYLVERNRPPVTVREVVFVDREPPAEKLVADPHPSESDEAAAAIDAPRPAGPSLRGPYRSPFLSRLTSLGADPTSNYIALRRLVLMRGIDALPQREYTGDAGPGPEPVGPPITARQLMKEFVPSPTAEDTKDAGSTFRQEPTHDDMRGTT